MPEKKVKYGTVSELIAETKARRNKTQNVQAVQKDNTSVLKPELLKKLTKKQALKVQEDLYRNPQKIENISSEDKVVDFLYNNDWLLDTPIIGNYIKDKAKDIAGKSGGQQYLKSDEIKDALNSKSKGNYSGDITNTRDRKNTLLNQYFSKEPLYKKSKYKPDSDYLEFLPSYSIKENYKGEGFNEVLADIIGDSIKYEDFIKNKNTLYKNFNSDSGLSDKLNVDLGGHKLGASWDKKRNLPYISISDAWDFEPKHYAKKWTEDIEKDSKKEATETSYIQSYLMHKAGNPFKVYDRFYFDPKTKKYIPDNQDIEQFADGGNIDPKNLRRNSYKEYSVTQVDGTKVSNYNDAKKFNPKARNKTDKEIAQEREARINASIEARKNPYTKENWREQLAAETNATGDKLRVSNKPNFFDDYINPAAMIGGMASNLGSAPLRAKQEDSVLPYVTAAGVPLVTGALAGIGAGSTKQFVNNLANPLAGAGDLVNNLGNKYLPNLGEKIGLKQFTPNSEAYYRIVGQDAVEDALQSKLIRNRPTNNLNQKGTVNLSNRPTAFPSFSKGKISTEYANGLPNHGLIETERLMKPSNMGRHGKGTTQFPTDAEGNYLNQFPIEEAKIYKRDWLRGYKEIDPSAVQKAYGGEIVPPKKVVKDKRTSGQILSVNPIEELGHTMKRPIPVNTGEMKYSKSNDPEYNNARKDFVNWYSNPETKERFVKNTGYDSGRLYDMMSKATAIPSHKGDAQKQPPVGTKAVFTTPDTGKKEEIVYHGGIGTGPIQHELTHAGAMANIIGPSLLRTLGSPSNQKLPSDINDPNFKSTSNSVKDYMSIPEEAYGNFHEFRVNLGLKPGEQIDIDTLRQKVKDKNLQQENFYNTFEDQKIVDAINKIAYNDNTNTNNIQQAAMGGNINNNLNQFDEGGTHEENPLGGIPMGQNASVEEGETMKGNFVYSDRVVLSPEIVSQMGLPKTFVGKTAADASKIINKKFEDRNDKISDSTKISLLDKVAEAQEAVKAEQQAQLQQSMEANSAMAPEDQMQGQIPQGMEEYAQPQEMPVEQPQMAYGGRVKFFLGGVPDMGSSLTSAVDMGKELFGKSEINTSGLSDTPEQMTSMSNQAFNGLSKGAQLGTSIMPGIGTAIGAGVGAISGIIGASKDKRALQQAQTNRQTRQFNTATSDFAMGGDIRKQYVKGGPVPLQNLLKPAGLVNMKNQTINDIQPQIAELPRNYSTVPRSVQIKDSIVNAVKDNYGEALNYAPVASNLLQLKNLRKPEVVNAIRNDRRFQYDPADVRSQLNLAQSEMDNSVNALSNANMSQGALSNSILAANLNKNKVLSDAYFNADNQNRSMKIQEQSVNNALDEANISREINAQDINAQNRGAYDSAKSKMIADLGTNLGKIGKGRTEDLMIRKMFGYTKSGNFYTKADGSIVSPEEMSKAMLAVKGIQTPETKAKGGYINNYKRF